MTRLAGWVTAFGLVACTKGPSEAPTAIPPAPNAKTTADLLPGPAPVPPVTGPKDFTLVYTHNLDGEIEPCG
jgi:hypothetical protein